MACRCCCCANPPQSIHIHQTRHPNDAITSRGAPGSGHRRQEELQSRKHGTGWHQITQAPARAASGRIRPTILLQAWFSRTKLSHSTATLQPHLAAVGVGAGVGHGQQAGHSVLELEVLIREGAACRAAGQVVGSARSGGVRHSPGNVRAAARQSRRSTCRQAPAHSWRPSPWRSP